MVVAVVQVQDVVEAVLQVVLVAVGLAVRVVAPVDVLVVRGYVLVVVVVALAASQYGDR